MKTEVNEKNANKFDQILDQNPRHSEKNIARRTKLSQKSQYYSITDEKQHQRRGYKGKTGNKQYATEQGQNLL